ncbi:MAG: response regulator transcription factor [Gemmatimonadetes bacterium]|nr:response regulator transcription factor [Gemmatimonadota bacterium]
MSPHRPASEHPPGVLVVEDDRRLRATLKAALAAHGFAVTDAASGEEALALAKERAHDVVVLDLALPGIDGIEVARRLRAWSTVPILVLSARGQEQSKVQLLDAGADDYLTKPFGTNELVARLRALLRRAGRGDADPTAAMLIIGPLHIDRAERRVHLDGEEVRLTPTEYDLLAALAKNAGRTVTHRRLLAEVWKDRSEEHAGRLRVYMTYLRRKLERAGRPRLLTTQAGVGYRLNAE